MKDNEVIVIRLLSWLVNDNGNNHGSAVVYKHLNSITEELQILGQMGSEF